MNGKTNIEFLIMLNDNIVIQRDWTISNYNKQAKNSIEFLELMDDLKENMIKYLSRRSSDYMVEYRKEIINDEKFLNIHDSDEDELFHIYIKKDGNEIAHRSFSAKMFPAVIRYRLDVRPFMDSIRDELFEVLKYKKNKELTYEYLGYSTI